MPSVLQELLQQRSATKKLMKKETDSFMKNVLDKRQLSIKLTANSLYGQCGAKTSSFYEKDVAASTTATGRTLLTYAKRLVEEVYGDRQCETKNYGSVLTKAEYVYGDSVLGDTPLLLRNKMTGHITFHEIQQLGIEQGKTSDHLWQPYEYFKAGESGRYNKEQMMANDFQIYTSSGWSDIRRVIRHKTTKDIYRITTHTGMVDVTEDHSLLDEHKQIIKPNSAICGTRLLHHYPNVGSRMETKLTLSDFMVYVETSHKAPLDEKRAFIWGFFFGDGSCGKYNCPSGVKYSWALNNKSYRLCSRLQYLCQDVYGCLFKINNTLKSSGVYKIVPTGSIKAFIDEFRPMCYYNKLKIIPEKYLNASDNIKIAYLAGYYAADGAKCINSKTKNIRLSNKGKIGSAMLFYMFKSIGLNVSINTRKDKPNITNLSITSGKLRKCPNAIKKNDLLYKGYTDYVYDIETVEGNFNTGYPLIVKNTDSVFFTFNLTTMEGEKIIGKKALEITIELAQEVGELASHFLKQPHDLEYEKTFQPFALLSKKRYVGILYEFDVNKGKRKEMGIVLKRRDNAPIVKDCYGGVIDILMKGGTVDQAIQFIKKQLQLLIDGKIAMEKLIITKSLRGHYKNPSQIAHCVLAERIGRRDPGNKPRSGDRIAYVYIKNADKKALQGDRIETPEYINEHNLEIDYNHYITNQIMKPLLQLFGLVLDEIPKGLLKSRKT